MADRAALASAWAEGALLGSAIAALAAGIAVLRIGGGALGWLALAGLGALALGPAIGALRALRPLPRLAFAVPLGMLVALPMLSLLGRVLKATTHHRPLGAATFAVLAAGVVLGCVALVGRLLAASAADAPGLRKLARATLIALAVACAGAGALLALPALSTGGGVRAPVLEALLALALGAVAGLVTLPGSLGRVTRVLGPVLWMALVAGAGAATAL